MRRDLEKNLKYKENELDAEPAKGEIKRIVKELLSEKVKQMGI